MRKLLLLATIFIVAIMTTDGFAAQGREKITVTSNQQSIDYAKGTLIYEGNVRINWKDYIIEANKVEVYLTPDKTLEKIIATGEVKMNQDTKVQVSCRKATYLARDRILILEEEVEYQDEIGNTLQAQKVTIWTLEEKLQAEGNPVKANYILEEEEIGPPGGESK